MQYTKAQHEIDRLILCTEVVDRTFATIKEEMPTNADERADLLLTTEALARSVAKLLHHVHETVWPQADEDLEDE